MSLLQVPFKLDGSMWPTDVRAGSKLAAKHGLIYRDVGEFIGKYYLHSVDRGRSRTTFILRDPAKRLFYMNKPQFDKILPLDYLGNTDGMIIGKFTIVKNGLNYSLSAITVQKVKIVKN